MKKIIRQLLLLPKLTKVINMGYMKILVTGGAGYVGTTLIPQLLEKGTKVHVLDNLTFGGPQLLPFFRHRNFSFQKGDIRNIKDIWQATKGADAIIHLAAVVGYPACRKDPKAAVEINVNGIKNLIKSTSKKQLILFASTGSSYGHVREEVTEKTPLSPLSLYGQTKGLGEELLRKRGNVIIFRFMTAFGVSPRLRLDLLINDFVYKAVTQQYLVIYEKNFKRAFIHVHDMGRSLVFGLENAKKMVNEVFNIGSDSMGFSKEELAEIIKKYVEVYVHYAEVGEDEDRRNYVVSFKKINELGFSTTVDVHEGIKELIESYKAIQIVNPYANA